ncbi:MAG: DivIVA domain-containing protein [Clostridia bacterium]|nr:DivIVA domain-containing protein [Clostridia bacterium]
MKRKNKKIARFRIKHRGYDIAAVESFIANEQARADEVQLSQRERIAALTDECRRLEAELAELKGREEQIKSAFITATQNADRMTADVKARYTAELERLRLFRAKWTAAYDQLKERYHFDKDALNMESVAVTTQLELQKFLMQDFSLNKGSSSDEMEDYFRSEVERLTTQQINEQKGAAKQPISGVAELKEKIKEAETRKKAQSAKEAQTAAFSFEEALNPTESLADICKSLGLNSL